MPRRYLDRRAEAEIEAMLAREAAAQMKHRDDSSDEQRSGVAKQAGAGRRAPGDWQGLVEQRIQDGMERGLFDNLAGAGKPLDLDADRFVPDELKMAFRLLRSTGLAPLWVDMNKEIRQDIERMHRFRAHVHSRWASIPAVELDVRRKEYIARINEINAKIINYNIVAPSSYVHMGQLIPADELAAFDAGPTE